MKTTIDFPDELLHRAKVVAAQRRTTLRELAVKGLEQALETESHKESTESARKERVRNILEALQATNTEPMVPLAREEIYDRHMKD
ncbi:hypothetical protein HNR46_002345 [Haloferula luteola]|uniref:Uncharacterized protein n=1 Tax=Haloferula luteola TaxID=595692 RepID=A0A840V935_9BACT|nr:hypothetical protein [Haloferula luteola]MBB5352104.1 hypothetical protein [Haloferula luteola]